MNIRQPDTILKNLDSVFENFKPEYRIEVLNALTNIMDINNLDLHILRKLVNNYCNIKKIGKHTFNYWYSRGWNYNESTQKQKEHSLTTRRSPFTIEYWTEKGYTLEEAEYKTKTFRKNATEYWTSRGYDEETATQKIVEFQKSNSAKLKEKKLNYPEFKVPNPTKLDYWLSKCDNDLEQAKECLKNRQSTFSKEICITKHGIDGGTEIFNQRQNKWQNTLHQNGNMKLGYSKISQELFDTIVNILNIKSESKYASNIGGEMSLRLNDKNYLYDYTYKNIIIEYNGDLYHANPDFYSTNECPNPFNKNLSASDIWKADKDKILCAEYHGYKVLTVWDSEYIKDKNSTVERCINFINLNRNLDLGI